ncbi:5-formyltetrahydrofolate cyclo-ligase [Sandarakinorhabdus sp. DWP1-3-1]|uniref:5-formyltetrahydrofolate cyclo-ligase n=1 Tax=Sandarakinorhabdus sp. DWP1-3-1 TaxID=2804627 RepID=UPI003CF4E354
MRDPTEYPKPALRRMFRSDRAAFVAAQSPAERARLEGDLAARVLPLLRGATVIASYAGVGAEVDPGPIEALLASSRPPPHVAFPLVTGRDLSFHIAAWADLKPGVLGIPEPAATAPRVTPDLLLVPLLAVTTAGVRLGQGGGYYDRTLRSLRAAGPVTAIGLAWDVQLADALPRDPWDELLDWVATPTRLVDCAKHR